MFTRPLLMPIEKSAFALRLTCGVTNLAKPSAGGRLSAAGGGPAGYECCDSSAFNSTSVARSVATSLGLSGPREPSAALRSMRLPGIECTTVPRRSRESSNRVELLEPCAEPSASSRWPSHSVQSDERVDVRMCVPVGRQSPSSCSWHCVDFSELCDNSAFGRRSRLGVILRGGVKRICLLPTKIPREILL